MEWSISTFLPASLSCPVHLIPFATDSMKDGYQGNGIRIDGYRSRCMDVHRQGTARDVYLPVIWVYPVFIIPPYTGRSHKGMKMRVLVLTGRFGMGHVAAAEAVAERLRSEHRDIEVDIVDLMEYIYPRICGAIYTCYNAMVDKMPRIYNSIICMDYQLSRLELKGKAANAEIISGLIEEHHPDAIVSTWLISSKYVEAYKKKTGDDIPFITCITDIMSSDEGFRDDGATSSQRKHARNYRKGVDRISSTWAASPYARGSVSIAIRPIRPVGRFSSWAAGWVSCPMWTIS